MINEIEAGPAGMPPQLDELAALEQTYRPFQGFTTWRGVRVDKPRWTRYAHALTSRAAVASDEEWAGTQDRLFRAAALESGALDGLFPANPELTTTVLDSAIRTEGAGDMNSAVEVVAECHRRALVLASEVAAAGGPVDANLIAVLADVIVEAQATYTVTTPAGLEVEVELPRRQYKPVSNYLVGPDGALVAFTPAGQVASEMARLSAELASADFVLAHPVVQAAYAHYALTAIHPFADGNGRLARTVASIYLMRAVGVPLVIYAEQWPSYRQALHRANGGDAQQLADFVAAAALAAMNVAANLLTAPLPRLYAGARALSRRRARPPRPVLEEAARGLLDALLIEMRDLLVSPPEGVRMALTQTRVVPDEHVEGAYRMVDDAVTGRFGVRFAARAGGDRPAPASADLEFVALVSEVPNDLLPIALREARSGELLEVALDDVYPLVLEPAVLRVRLWAQRLLAEGITPVLAAAAQSSGRRRERPRAQGTSPG